MKNESQIKLEYAEIFYKFALATSTTITSSDVNLKYYDTFSFLQHVVNKQDLELTKPEEKIGARILEFVATYIMILQLNKVLEDEWGKNRLQSEDKEIQNISQVVRLIRNAFAHDPLKPVWDISKSTMNMEFEITNILTLRTHNLHGKKLDRYDYGGPLALLRLIQYVKNKMTTTNHLL
ncbi:MAG: hypothetical protein KKI06_05670 [Euryarchaeota archaeon]|nr:hypothetical protein [Euryarchaeota archaeon]MBU4222411.1 hypothetical protein [Euryarchaeota archaeon]MCG2738598.1 hypothetical protein [Candidatus Methanoperedenaceae archaeon]